MAMDLLRENTALREEIALLQDKLRCFDDVRRSAGIIERLIAAQEELSKKIEILVIKIESKDPGTENKSSVRELIKAATREIYRELEAITSLVNAASASHQSLRELVHDHSVYYDTEIRILHEQSRLCKKREIQVEDFEGSLSGIDWESLLAQVNGDNKKFEKEVKDLMDEIERKGKKLSQKVNDNLAVQKISYSEYSLGPVISKNVPKIKDLGTNKIEVVEQKENNSKYETAGSQNSKPVQEEPISNTNAQKSFTNEEEYFEMELTDNSAVFGKGLAYGSQTIRENDMVKKLIFEDEKNPPNSVIVTKNLQGLPQAPPRSNLRQRKVNSQENSLVYRQSSFNNSSINESSASRRKKRGSNVIIRTRANSINHDSRLEKDGYLESPNSDKEELFPRDQPLTEQIDIEPSNIYQPVVPKRSSIFEALMAKRFYSLGSRNENLSEATKLPFSVSRVRGPSEERSSNAGALSHRIEIGIDRSYILTQK